MTTTSDRSTSLVFARTLAQLDVVHIEIDGAPRVEAVLGVDVDDSGQYLVTLTDGPLLVLDGEDLVAVENEDDDDDEPVEPNVPVAIRAALPDGFELHDLADAIRASFDRAAEDDRETGVLRDTNGNRIGDWNSGPLVEDDLDSRVREHRAELVAYVENSADAPESVDVAVEALVRLIVLVAR